MCKAKNNNVISVRACVRSFICSKKNSSTAKHELTNERTQIKYVWGKAGLMKEGVQDFLDRIKSAPIAEGNVK